MSSCDLGSFNVSIDLFPWSQQVCQYFLVRRGPVLDQDIAFFDNLPVDLYMLLVYENLDMYYDLWEPLSSNFQVYSIKTFPSTLLYVMVNFSIL